MERRLRGGGTAMERVTDLNGGELRAAGSIRRNVERVRKPKHGDEAETREADKVRG